MIIRYEDFNLYYQHTYLMVDDKLSYIRGVHRATTQTNYEIQIQTVSKEGKFEDEIILTGRAFPEHVKPFVPAYGYVNYDRFAVLCTLSAARMARKAFSFSRVEFSVPNEKELSIYLQYLGLRRMPEWASTPAMARSLANPDYPKSFGAGLDMILDGSMAGIALSPDFAVASLLSSANLSLYYKDKQVAQIRGDREILWEEKSPFKSLFESQISTKEAA